MVALRVLANGGCRKLGSQSDDPAAYFTDDWLRSAASSVFIPAAVARGFSPSQHHEGARRVRKPRAASNRGGNFVGRGWPGLHLRSQGAGHVPTKATA